MHIASGCKVKYNTVLKVYLVYIFFLHFTVMGNRQELIIRFCSESNNYNVSFYIFYNDNYSFLLILFTDTSLH